LLRFLVACVVFVFVFVFVFVLTKQHKQTNGGLLPRFLVA
jgi:hypothetical protein